MDLRTAITGVTLSNLKGVTLRRAGAAARLAALLGPDVVLVGHSLNADLAALKIDHAPVIDTALLFSYRGLAHATPSLVQLAQRLLGQTLRGEGGGGSGSGGSGGAQQAAEEEEEGGKDKKRKHKKGEDGEAAAEDEEQDGGGSSSSKKEKKKRKKEGKDDSSSGGGGEKDGGSGGASEGVHDPAADAGAAMALVRYELAREAAGAPTPPLDPPAERVPREEQCKLLVHGVPSSLRAPEIALTYALGAAGAPAPVAVEAADGAAGGAAGGGDGGGGGGGAAAAAVGGPRRLFLVFENPAVANAAFAALPGAAGTDSVGRQQKQLELRGGAKVRVRKMAAHGGAAFGRDAKADRGAPKKDSGKKKKAGKAEKQKHKAKAADAAAVAAAAAAADATTRAEKRKQRAARFKEGLVGGERAKKKSNKKQKTE